MGFYLVTGGCGFIGSHLVDALRTRRHRVRVLDDLSTGTTDYCPPDVELVLGDVADQAVVARSFQEIDGCFHLAAVASVERGNADWFGTHRTNLSGCVAVFEAARSVAGRRVPVVFASSAAVYGDPVETPLSEHAITRPLSAYGADKLGCELHGYVASNLHGIPTCGLRFFNVYGPRQQPNSPYAGVISIFCDQLRRGQAVTLNGDGGQTRDFIYVSDVVKALFAAMDRCPLTGDVVNVCTGSATTISSLPLVIARLLDRQPEVRHRASREADIRHSVGDPTKAHAVLGFSAETDLITGLGRLIHELR